MSISALGGSTQMMRSFQPPSFSSLDTNENGGITLKELKSGAPGGASDSKSSERVQKLFTAMDADQNGSVSSGEKDAFDQKIKEQMQAMQFMAQQFGSGGPPSADGIFSASDQDSDGSVTLEEFSSSEGAKGLSTEEISELFGAIDEDQDGSISSEESESFLEDMKQAGPPPGMPMGPPPAEASDEEDESAQSALDLLSIASKAYGSTSNSTDLLSVLSSALDEAA